jgi:hypothetical protein
MADEPGGGASRTTDPAAGTSAATDVSLREYLAAIIQERSNLNRSAIVALGLFGAFAWSEIQRRLEILNHENARLLAQQEKTVSQDTYAANEQQRKEEQTEYKKWKEDVDRDRTQSIGREEFQRDTRQQKQGVFDNSTKLALIAVAVLSVFITFFATRHTQTPPPPIPTVTTITTPK